MTFSWFYEKKDRNPVYLGISFLTIFVFCSLRFFVGNDYEGYFFTFNDIRDGKGTYMELGFYLVNNFFSFSEVGYLYVFALTNFLFLFLMFKTLLRYKILTWGIFFLFTAGLLIMSNDQIRQGLAIAVFLYSLRFIEERNFLKYIFIILFNFIFIHFSSILLLPLYFINIVNVTKYKWVCLVSFIVVYFLSVNGVFNGVLSFILKYSPFYQKYATKAFLLNVSDLSSGLGTFYMFLLVFIVILFSNHIKNKTVVNITVLGGFIFLMNKDFLLTKRLTFYLLFSYTVSLPLFLKITFKNFSFNSLCQIGLIISAFIYFEIQNLYAKEQFGAIPYRTFLMEPSLINPKSEYFQRDYSHLWK